MIITEKPLQIVKNASLTIKLVNGAVLKAERARGDSIYAMTPEELERKLKKESFNSEALDKLMQTVNLFWEQVM